MGSFIIQESKDAVMVVFNKSSHLADAPRKQFSKMQFRSLKQAKDQAVKYGHGIEDLHIQTTNLAFARTTFPALNYKKVRIQTANSRNKTGVVGVYLQRRLSRKTGKRVPYAYVSNYTVNGKTKHKYFPIGQHGVHTAFELAVQHRLKTINTHIDLL